MGHALTDAASRYTSDFGGYGHDPLVREVGAARDMTTSATTTDLAAGTARATRQLPGLQKIIMSHAVHNLHAFITCSVS